MKLRNPLPLAVFLIAIMPETQATALPTPAIEAAPAQAHNQTEVFAVFGADPEVLAYAMAKYSRSSLSMKESLREISSQRAEQFLNTFYFQYGHRSIADLAHVAMAIERLSLAAAIVLVDEQRWDGQERSTRYQNFSKSGWYLPEFGSAEETRQLYTETIGALFSEYHATAEGMFVFLREKTPRPEEMKPEAFDRTLKARAFDVARYLLPLATNTSLGQIVNARTLEGQVSRLLSHPAAEIRELGRRLKDAAAGEAWNVQREPMAALQAEIAALDPTLAAKSETLLTREVKTAPTLVKYATPNEYSIQTRRELADAAAALMKGEPIAVSPVVDLVEPTETLEVELATSLLYGVCHYPYRQLRAHVEALTAAQQEEIVDIGMRQRGKHDELLREFSAGQSLALRYPDGYWRFPRHAPPSQVHPDAAAVHLCARIRGAGQPDRGGIAASVRGGHDTGPCGLRQDCASPARRRQRSPLATCCRWARATARSSRWILRRLCISPSCGLRHRATSPTAGWRGRCTRRSRCSILRWQSTSASRMCMRQWICSRDRHWTGSWLRGGGLGRRLGCCVSGGGIRAGYNVAFPGRRELLQLRECCSM